MKEDLKIAELSKEEMQKIDGGFWWWVIGFAVELGIEYIYDSDEAMANFEKGYNSTRGK